MRYFGAFAPLPYMAGQRYIVPVFNRLSAAALLRGFILTLVVLNFFLKREKLGLFRVVSFFMAASAHRTQTKFAVFADYGLWRSQFTRKNCTFVH